MSMNIINIDVEMEYEHTLRADKSISMSKKKIISGAEKFNPSDTKGFIVSGWQSCGSSRGRWIQSGCEKKSNIIARVGLHNITSRDSHIHFIYSA